MAKNRNKRQHRRSKWHNNNQKIINKRKHRKNKRLNNNNNKCSVAVNKINKNRNKQKWQHRRDKRHNNNKQKMIIDLSAASDDGLALILLRMPVKDLLFICTQVSRQWRRILSEKFFWCKKMEEDGYVLEWPRFADISTESFQWMALAHCFNRNFIRDRILDGGMFARIQIPPVFVDGEPGIPPGSQEPITTCLSIGGSPFVKHIDINLAHEGLTEEIMDNFRPTIVVSEIVRKSRNCQHKYAMNCFLEVSPEGGHLAGQLHHIFQSQDSSVIREHKSDENGLWVAEKITIRFNKWEAEGWHRVEHIFRDYPAGMRYLSLVCYGGGGRKDAEGIYGLKLANCSVKAIYESDNSFWLNKMKIDGYQLEWPKLVGLSTESFKWMALKHCFNRNFFNDKWKLEERSLTYDPNWEASRIVKENEDNDDCTFARIEIPPKFLDGKPKISHEFDKPTACIAVGHEHFYKATIIKLSDEGLTNEIMDNFRPTIVVSEMVGNRRNCTTVYQMSCSLAVSIRADDLQTHLRDDIPNEDERGYHDEVRDENGLWIGVSIALRFNQTEAEGWHRVEHTFKDYPAGMRFLLLYCSGMELVQENEEHQYGLKLANFSLKALCEKNIK